ncbi:MAG: hypothetical protein IJX12_08130, partial [Lachnospiraceae bacterium]|nr:hypothetical protein [Lachnospiraceae bacterium]
IESVAKYADRVVVLEKGSIVYSGAPANAFYELWNKDRKEMYNLPAIMQLLIRLRMSGLPVDCFAVDMDQGIEYIKRALGWHYNR